VHQKFWSIYYEAHRRFVLVPHNKLLRYRVALAYARNRLSKHQAQSMVYDIERASGWYHLVSLDVEYAMEEALERWQLHPELHELVDEACEYVAGKHEDHNGTAYYAKGWALEKVEEYVSVYMEAAA
jgi:hypothetical protein